MAAQIPSTSDIIRAVGGKGETLLKGWRQVCSLNTPSHCLSALLAFLPSEVSSSFFFFFFVFIYLAALGLSCNM